MASSAGGGSPGCPGAGGAPAQEQATCPPKTAGSQLDLSDLDEEDLKALSEVSRKGYYHGRPKSEAVQSGPQRLDVGCPDAATDAGVTRKRTEFDQFQRKWDHFERAEEADEEDEGGGASSRTRIAPAEPARPPPPSPVEADEAVVEQLVAMGFGPEESRTAACATRNRADAAVDFLLRGGAAAFLGGGAVASAAAGTAAASSAAARAGPVTADPEKVAMLTEMGIPERLARQALVKCRNQLDRAVELATGGDMEDEALAQLSRARSALAELEAEVSALEGGGGHAGSKPAAQGLRGVAETLTQVSCGLDAIDIEGDATLRGERRIELDRCNALDARLAALRGPGGGSSEGSPAATAAASSAGRAAAPSEPETPSAASAAAPPQAAAAPAAQGSGGGAGGAETAAAQERIAEAERLRLAGNDAFKAGRFGEAVKHYSGALELDGENVAILSNLAAAELKLEHFEAAAAHAGAANELSGGFSAKALFRQGQAFEGLGQLSKACDAYQCALQVEPRDNLISQRLKECRMHCEGC